MLARYVFHSLAGLLTGLVFIIITNWAIDPFWYSGGNKVTGVNFGFDERTSRTILLLRDLERYDCLVFGSSVSTVLDPASFQQNECYNYAVSAGQIEEYLILAEYIKKRGYVPRKIYLELNLLALMQSDNEENIADFVSSKMPDFIEEMREPQGELMNYLSLDTFRYSIRALLGLNPTIRLYDKNFVCNIKLDAAPHFDPKSSVMNQPLDIRWVASRFAAYQRFRDIFPDSEIVAFVHPVSVWHVTRYHQQGLLLPLLEESYQLNQIFDKVFDFAVPSEITINPSLTWDGTHYLPEVYSSMAARMEGKQGSFGLALQDLSYSSYKDVYLNGIQKFSLDHRARSQ